MTSLANHQTVTSKQLRELYSYNPCTGELKRKTQCGCGKIGQEITSDYISINYQKLVVGRVIWCWWYGEWPSRHLLVEHINQKHYDRKITNLRLATKSQNAMNSGPRAGHAKGIYYNNSSWVARIMVNGVRIHIGSFATQDEAALAYDETARLYFGEYVP